MESKKFFLGEHFTSYDDLREKVEKFEEENFVSLWIRDSHTIEAAKVKKIYNPAITFYEIRYACKHGGRKFKSESTGVRSLSYVIFSSSFVTVQLKNVLNQL